MQIQPILMREWSQGLKKIWVYKKDKGKIPLSLPVLISPLSLQFP